MKNPLHSLLFYLFKCCFKFNRKNIFLLVFGFFIFTSTSVYAQLPITYDFESGLQGWTNNGNDSGRLVNANWACNSSASIFSKDNDATRNWMISPTINLTAYNDVDITFCHKSVNVDNGEGFWLQYFDGSNWSTVKTFTLGTDFFNNGSTNEHNLSFHLDSDFYNFATNSRFRLRGTANNDNEWNFFDNISITVSPPCTQPINQPTSITFNSITETTMNMSFVPATSSPDNYLVIYNTTGITPSISDGTNYTIGSIFSGNTVLSNDATTSFVLSGLTDNTTYYFFIYSFNSKCAGGPDYLTNNPLTDTVTTAEYCSLSTANGTSVVGCPSVDAGGLGLSGSDIAPINCNASSTSATLEANYLDLGDTTSYNVEAIAYSPPFQYGCLANPVSVNIDDRWSDIVNLPFDFCFYGNTYNSCVIGSNGVISFNTGLANSYSGWRFTDNIPANNNSDAGFFGPSIYGVHHDVDPSVGGEIGYQLITLDSGCRALVASWFRVPMYQNNSLLYTGMIVFYEDTNIIEVYIEEKNIDGSWNDGNATVGIQANASEGMSAPGRNSRDTNWNAVNEAWRFTPNGNSITELKWYENSISAANEIIDPNDDGQITVSPSSTTDYFAEVTYTLCNGTTFTEIDQTTVTLTGGKIWDGSESNDWDDPDNWTPSGVPTITECITIPPTANNPRIDGPIDGTGYNLEILDGADLLQRPNSTLTIDDKIIIESNASFRLRTNASLIQINDVVSNMNVGAAEVRRTVNGVGNLDYVYWSSPVEGFNVGSVSPNSPSSTIYNWNPTMANGTVGRHGTWTNTLENMIPGKGYIIRGLDGTPAANQAQFEGTLNNGQISFPISRGNYTGADYAGIGNTATAEDDNWNLIGNPYPSAISLTDFVAANPAIDGTLYFWRHLNLATTAINDPFYEDYVYNYNPNDYLAANSLGSTPSGFNGYIASGQGFFALMLDSAPTPNTVNFSNTMRGLYANNVFYRNASGNTENKHRIWLDFVDDSNLAISTLVGFADGATDGIDRLYDGFVINQSNSQFYSLEADNKLTIQGKALPFDDTKTIPLGFKTPNLGSYKISINKLDGLFEDINQKIYLEDKELNIIHNLRDNPYPFSSDSGTFNDRFVLRFNNSTLSIEDQDIISNLSIKSINKRIDATSTHSNIKTFELFDITGRTIHKNINVNNTNYVYQTTELSQGTYIVQVLLANGSVISKKVII